MRRAEPPLPVDEEQDHFTEAVPVDNSTESSVVSEDNQTTVEPAAITTVPAAENVTQVANRDAAASTEATTTKAPVPLPEPSRDSIQLNFK